MKYLSKLTLTLTIMLAAFTMLSAGKINIADINAAIPNDPTVLVGKLANGLTYYIKENKEPENRAELQILIKAGSLDEEDNQSGLAHFTEHMAFNGSKHFKKNELVKYFESVGMNFGTDLNANTSYERTYYLITVPTDKPELVDNGMLVLEDWLHNLDFDAEEIEKERGVIHEEWRVYRGVQTRARKTHFEALLKGSKWAERDIIGDTAVILHAPRERFTSFYNDWYRPSSTAIILVGDFDKNEMLKKVKKHFTKIKNPKNEKTRPDFPIPLKNETLVSIHKDKEWPAGPLVQIYIKSPKMNNVTYNEYKEALKNRLISTMLSKRYQELLNDPKTPLTQFAGGSYSGFIGNLDAFSLVGLAKPGKTNQAYQAILGEAFRAEQHGFTSGELKRAKIQILAGVEASYNEREKTASKSFAFEYYQHFLDKTFYPGITVEKDLTEQFLPEIKLVDLNKLVKKYLTSKSVVITITSKDDEVLPSKKELATIFRETQGEKFAPYVDTEITKPLMAKIPIAGKVVKEENIKEIDAVKWTLSNGAEVYLKKTDFKNDQIMFSAMAPGGTSLAPNNNLLNAQYACNIVDESGIADFNKIDLAKVLTGKRVGISPRLGNLNRGFGGYSSPKDLETFMQLLNLYFTSPRIDANSFEIFKKEQVQNVIDAKNDPATAFREKYSMTLYNNHLRKAPTTVDEMKQLDMNKAFNFYKSQFDGAGQFKFIFVGAIDFAVMKKFVETYIASLPVGKKMNWKDNGERYATGIKKEIVYSGQDEKTEVRIALPNTFKYSYDNVFAMKVVSKILSTRLREEVREEKGGTYGVGAWVSPTKYPKEVYQVGIAFTTSPKKVDDLLVSVQQVLTNVKAGKFDVENADKIKTQLTRKRQTDLKKNRFWLNTIYSSLYNNSPFSLVNDYDKYLNKINKDYIVKNANKFIIEKNWIQVLKQPVADKK